MALSTLYKLLDDKLTSMLKPYLAIGYGSDGKPYSDVIVKEGNVEIINLFARTEKINDTLASMALPFAVKMFHCNDVKVRLWPPRPRPAARRLARPTPLRAGGRYASRG